MIAINQLVDIKLRLLRSPEEQNRKRLISTQWLVPHLGVLLLLASGCDFLFSLLSSFTIRLLLLIIFLCSKVHATGLQELHWAYLWSFCASLWFAVSFMVWIELDFSSALTRWHWTLSSFPSLALKNPFKDLRRAVCEDVKMSLNKSMCSFACQPVMRVYVHVPTRVSLMVWVCNRMHMLHAGCCQRQTVFFCIDYGWIKQTLVRSVYTEMTV